jgi:hypothetical protein
LGSAFAAQQCFNAFEALVQIAVGRSAIFGDCQRIRAASSKEMFDGQWFDRKTLNALVFLCDGQSERGEFVAARLRLLLQCVHDRSRKRARMLVQFPPSGGMFFRELRAAAGQQRQGCQCAASPRWLRKKSPHNDAQNRAIEAEEEAQR